MSALTIRRVAAVALVGVIGATGAGCGTTMRDLPLPGTGVSGDTIELTAEFDEALNLAVGAPVKVNGVDSGKVTKIEAADFRAEVTLVVKEDAEIREGATVRLRYTTPLGELFLDVTNPTSGPVLTEDDSFSLKETETAPTVEDALSQASILINGGGLEQLRTITDELNNTLGGNEENVRGLLDKANVFLREANATTANIDRVLTSINSLSQTLTSREDLFNRAMREIRPAARVLREATPEFTRLLQEIERFSGQANATVNATRTQLLNLLSEVEPVLAEISANRPRFNRMLSSIVRAADIARTVVPNEYLNINVGIHFESLLDVTDLLGALDINLPLDALNDLLNQLGLGGILPRSQQPGGRSTPTDPGGVGDALDDGALGGVTDGLSDALNGLFGGGN